MAFKSDIQTDMQIEMQMNMHKSGMQSNMQPDMHTNIHKIEFDELCTPICSPSICNCQDSKRVVTSAYFGQTPHCAAGSAYWTAPAGSAHSFPLMPPMHSALY